MNYYPKDSEVYLVEAMDDLIQVEKELITIFEEIYERATTKDCSTFIGNEYFVAHTIKTIKMVI